MNAAERYGAGGDNSTRKFPRSMAEAFWPHTDSVLHPMPDPPRHAVRLEEKAAQFARLAREAAGRLVVLVAGH